LFEERKRSFNSCLIGADQIVSNHILFETHGRQGMTDFMHQNDASSIFQRTSQRQRSSNLYQMPVIKYSIFYIKFLYISSRMVVGLALPGMKSNVPTKLRWTKFNDIDRDRSSVIAKNRFKTDEKVQFQRPFIDDDVFGLEFSVGRQIEMII
jgi:hypothetical protein